MTGTTYFVRHLENSIDCGDCWETLKEANEFAKEESKEFGAVRVIKDFYDKKSGEYEEKELGLFVNGKRVKNAWIII